MSCLRCGSELTGRQRKFCSRTCKNSYNHRHKYNYAYHRKCRSANPRNFMSQLLSYGDRRKTLDIDFLVGLYEKQGGLCAISKQPMTHTAGGGRNPSNISIDRIDNSKGYERDNVQLVCHLVNTMKTHYTVETLIEWCGHVVNANKPQR
jgi:hypothetical protein